LLSFATAPPGNSATPPIRLRYGRFLTVRTTLRSDGHSRSFTVTTLCPERVQAARSRQRSHAARHRHDAVDPRPPASCVPLHLSRRFASRRDNCTRSCQASISLGPHTLRRMYFCQQFLACARVPAVIRCTLPSSCNSALRHVGIARTASHRAFLLLLRADMVRARRPRIAAQRSTPVGEIGSTSYRISNARRSSSSSSRGGWHEPPRLFTRCETDRDARRASRSHRGMLCNAEGLLSPTH